LRTIALLGSLVLAGAAARAEEPRRWTLSAEAGPSRLHENGVTTWVGALRLHRSLGAAGVLRLQLGAAASGYGTLDAGLEVHPWSRARVSPFLGAGAGYITEESEYEGPFVRGTVGIEAKLSPRVVLRLAVQAGTHDGQAGPHAATIGIGWRF
jgi:hypothetical protein